MTRSSSFTITGKPHPILLVIDQSIRECTPGVGTYARGGFLYASMPGQLEVAIAGDQSTSSVRAPPALSGSRYMATISPIHRRPAEADNLSDEKRIRLASDLVIREGQIVLATVTRLSTTQVFVEISAIPTVGILPFSHEGVIRMEDIRPSIAGGPAETETRQINSLTLRVAEDAFCPGDIILARVLGGGNSDIRRYPLSTAEKELGVVYARSSTSGQRMVPQSWKEMVCPETGRVENRKVARPPS
jgi:exosome complex RNA-binding protein Csl4